MGQAKLRGGGEERIAQSKATKRPPEKGVYVSTKKPVGMRYVVEDVTLDEDEEGFFLVQMIDEASTDDMSAMGDELDPDEWFALAEFFTLNFSATDCEPRAASPLRAIKPLYLALEPGSTSTATLPTTRSLL